MSAHVRHREFRFPVAISWDGARRTTARVAGKQPLPIATPPEFKGTDPDLWSPEDAFVAAAGSCLGGDDRRARRARAASAAGALRPGRGGRRPPSRRSLRVRAHRADGRGHDGRRARGRRPGRDREGRGDVPGRGLARFAGADDRRAAPARAGGIAIRGSMREMSAANRDSRGVEAGGARSCGHTRSIPARACSTSCAARTSHAWTLPATWIWTTQAAACSPLRSCESTSSCCREACSATRTRSTRRRR